MKGSQNQVGSMQGKHDSTLIPATYLIELVWTIKEPRCQRRNQLLFNFPTCWRPRLDVACAMDHHEVRLSILHRSKPIPARKRGMKTLTNLTDKGQCQLMNLNFKVLGHLEI